MNKKIVAAATGATALASASILWFAMQQHPTLGHAAKAEGFDGACWMTNCDTPNCVGYKLMVTKFDPDVPFTIVTQQTNLFARYGFTVEQKRSTVHQEDATLITQYAPGVITHPSNPYRLVNNDQWTNDGDYPRSRMDLMTLCRFSANPAYSHQNTLFNDLMRRNVELYPPMEPSPTPSVTPTATTAPTPCPTGCTPIGFGQCACPTPTTPPTPSPSPTPTTAPTATPNPCAPAIPRCPPLTAVCQQILDLGGNGGLQWVTVGAGRFRQSQWKQCKAQALRTGCVR